MPRRGGAPPTLYLCHTATGAVAHLCRALGGVTLCGHLVASVDRNMVTRQPVAFADHWRNGATGPGGRGLCEHCEAKAP